MTYSQRIPVRLRIALRAGTTTWSQVPRSERFYYQTGAVRGGSYAHDNVDGPETSEMPQAFLSDTEYDANLTAYAEALDRTRQAYGQDPTYPPKDTSDYPSEPVKSPRSVADPAVSAAAGLAVWEAMQELDIDGAP